MSKQRYVWLNGEKIYVTEEVYYAYYRPVWREAKQRKVRSEMECSIEFLADVGVEVDSGELPLDEIVSDKLLVDKLYEVLDDLTDDERKLLHALYFQCKTEREYSTKSGIAQKTINDRKKRLLERLKKKLKKF